MAPSPQFVRSIRLMREQVPTFDEYPFSLPAVRELFELPFHPSVTYLVGENGSPARPVARRIVHGSPAQAAQGPSALHLRRARGSAVAVASDGGAGPHTRAREEGCAVHHRDSLADPDGVPRCSDLSAGR